MCRREGPLQEQPVDHGADEKNEHDFDDEVKRPMLDLGWCDRHRGKHVQYSDHLTYRVISIGTACISSTLGASLELRPDGAFVPLRNTLWTAKPKYC